MKRVMIILFVASSLLVGCRASRESEGLHALVGILLVTGNEPFADLSLQTDDATIHAMRKDTGAVYRELWRLQGQKVRVWFRPQAATPDSSKLMIDHYEIVNLQ